MQNCEVVLLSGELSLIPSAVSGAPIDVNHLKTEVARIVASLTDLNRRSEPEFVRLGDGLQEVMDKVEHTREEITQALSIIKHDGGDCILARIETVQTEIAARFSDNAQTIQFCLDQMGKSLVQLRELNTRNNGFSEYVSRMNATGIYFSIEIVRLPSAIQVFSSYANDIRALFGEVHTSFNQIGIETGKNTAVQLNALNLVNRDYDIVSKDSRDALSESSETISAITDAATNTLERVIKYFSPLGKNVTRIVVAIQVGDITRQQIEHVIEALSTAPTEPMQDDRPDPSWCRLVSLQFAQLRHVRTELTDARATIQEALDEISTMFGILAADVDDLLSGARTVAVGAATWFSELANELQKMSDLETKTGIIFQQTLATVDQVLRALSHLQSHVHQIGNNNRRLRLEAFNARILSMRLGAEGRALTTLAKEVSDLSLTTRTYTDSVTGAIRTIVTIAEQASARIQSVRTAPGSNGSTKASDHRSNIDILETGIKELVRLTSEACVKARSLQDDMEALRKVLQAIDRVEQELEETLDALGTVVTTLAAAVGEPLHGETDVNQHHAERYTMEAERRIHLQLTGGHLEGTTGVVSSMASRKDVVVNDDDMGDNVQLF